MKAGTNMKIAGKTVYVIVLLTITTVMRSAGNNGVSVTVGDSSVLTCPFKGNVTLITWKISPKAGGLCTLAYRADTNTTHTNCSNSINWKVRPDLAPDLEVRQVEVSQEGNYTCEGVSTDGNFHTTYHLTVLAPPRVSLFCDEHGSPVCEAAAGKPPAHISWVAESSSTPLPEEKGHDNGTVTVSSRFSACSTSMTNVTTCMVFHPAGNWSQSIACCPSEETHWYVYIIACLLSIIIVMAVIYIFKFHSDRLCHKTKSPETAPVHSQQDDMMEVEPYTTYVQKENVIYNSVSDLTVGQNLPQDLWPET